MGSGWEGEGDGDEDRRGIIPRAIRDLFAGADQRAEEARAQGHLPPEFSVQAQFIELYNEDIVDLLDPAKDPFAKVSIWRPLRDLAGYEPRAIRDLFAVAD